jgi:hypothetical protein
MAMSAVDDVIKQWVQRAEQSGALEDNPSHGKPLNMNDGYLDTPEEVRMTYKILKNAGYVPAEVQALKDLAALREALNDCTDEQEKRDLRVKIANTQQKVAMMLERLSTNR